MNDAREGPGRAWVELPLPSWLYGTNLRGFLQECEMEFQQDRDVLRVTNRENYFKTAPALVRLIRAVGPDAPANGLEALVQMSDDEFDADIRAKIPEHISENPQDLVAFVVDLQLTTQAVDAAALPQTVTDVVTSLRAITMEDGLRLAMPAAAAYAIQRSDVLLWRLKLISVLLRVEHDPSLAKGDIQHLQTGAELESTVFAASQHLTSATYLLEAYVGPLVGALTPAVWGFAAYRGRGPVIFSFGIQLAGKTSRATELLDTLFVPGADRTVTFEPLDEGAITAACLWWVDALNALFATLTDWSLFADITGRYSAASHLQAVSTVEQLFRRVVSIQRGVGDLNARRVLLFTVMDTLEALTGLPIDKACDIRTAQRTLNRLHSALPAESHGVLLARAELAVQCLREVQDGFYLADDAIEVLIEPSSNTRVSRERAAAIYMKVLRNATHGHGAKGEQRERAKTLLARHTGAVPGDTALLGWLYLLDMLNNPDGLRHRLASRARA